MNLKYIESQFIPCYCVASEMIEKNGKDKVKVKIYNPLEKSKPKTIEKRFHIDENTGDEHIRKIYHCIECEEHTKRFFKNCIKLKFEI